MNHRTAIIAWSIVAAAGCSASTQSTTEPQHLTLASVDASLAATLVLPEDRTPPYPGIVIVHGSGRMTAGDLAGPAGRLRRLGFAVVTYDKRGVGGSTGEYSNVGPSNSERMFDLLARDALAGVAALKARRDIDRARIGLLGISQGGWISPLAASIGSDVAFIVTVAGPAVSVGEEIAYSRLAGEDPGSEQGLSDDEIAKRMSRFEGPHGYDPLPVLSRLSVPSFWVLGEHDRSIPLRRTVDVLTRLRDESKRPIALHVIPGVNHAMRNPVTGAQPDFWRAIAEWLTSIGVLRS